MDSPKFRVAGFLDILDPGDCLSICFRELKRNHPGASHRYIAAAIGMKSSASFALLVRGRIHPSPRIIDALARVFGLDQAERDHLALLFELRRVRDPSAYRILCELIRQRAYQSGEGRLSIHKLENDRIPGISSISLTPSPSRAGKETDNAVA